MLEGSNSFRVIIAQIITLLRLIAVKILEEKY